MEKIACIIIGDKNVRYTGLATLISVQKYNPELDLYICAGNGEDEDIEFDKLLANYSISNIMINSDMVKYLENYNCAFKTYPKNLFLRFYFPKYFAELGYHYLVSIDPDMLCTNRWEIQEILPRDDVYAYHVSHRSGMRFSDHEFLYIKKCLDIGSNINLKQDFPNGGFLVFNTSKFIQYNIQSEFYRFYNVISRIKIDHPEDELSMGVMNTALNISTKILPIRYNFRPAFFKYVGDYINIHYNYIKPWQICTHITENYKFSNQINWQQYAFFMSIYIMYLAQLPFLDKVLKNDINYVLRKLSTVYLNEDRSKAELLYLRSLCFDDNTPLSKFWKDIMIHAYIDPRVCSPLDLSKNYLQFKIPNINDIHYEFNFQNRKLVLSLDFESTIVRDQYKSFCYGLSQVTCYLFYDQPEKLCIYREVAYDKAIDELNFLINLTYNTIIENGNCRISD